MSQTNAGEDASSISDFVLSEDMGPPKDKTSSEQDIPSCVDDTAPPINPKPSLAGDEPQETDYHDEGNSASMPLYPQDDQPGTEAEGQVAECRESVNLEPDGSEEPEPSVDTAGKSWGGWGVWGKSLLTSATSTVGQSLSSVREKAGVALRLPQASLCEEAEEAAGSCAEGSRPEELTPPSTLASLPAKGVFSTITSAVQNTGKSVISGGLDALEFIGKKTMTVLAESDPGFKKTKTLMQKTVSLSQMLKEAKERERERLGNQLVSEPTAHYSILFDDYQGLSHLEALEILSNESEAKVQAVLSNLGEDELDKLKTELVAIKEIFIKRDEEEEAPALEENGDLLSSQIGSTTHFSNGEEFVSVLTELLFELHVAATPDKLNKARVRAHDWVKEVEQPVAMEAVEEAVVEEKSEESAPSTDSGENVEEGSVSSEGKNEERRETQEDASDCVEHVYLSSVGSLAEVTARSIEQLHKVAELILHGQDLEKAASEQASILVRLTLAMCKEVDCLARKFCDTLLSMGCHRKAEELNPLVDSVTLEGSNSTTYIHNAFQLLLPILQISHIQISRTKQHPDTVSTD
ncbi:protein NOXP20 isoform X1 [Alosa sapidissima]|uniref:protein NOXP20 isoform X1 n=1 Tax=Alosa sapidissima TaxID=34773 RepID=UPI001C09AC7E|nr:protein NOXP20 isoform X1 [Alosa sapidissima]